MPQTMPEGVSLGFSPFPCQAAGKGWLAATRRPPSSSLYVFVNPLPLPSGADQDRGSRFQMQGESQGLDRNPCNGGLLGPSSRGEDENTAGPRTAEVLTGIRQPRGCLLAGAGGNPMWQRPSYRGGEIGLANPQVQGWCQPSGVSRPPAGQPQASSARCFSTSSINSAT
jgi:hypothetical protein